MSVLYIALVSARVYLSAHEGPYRPSNFLVEPWVSSPPRSLIRLHSDKGFLRPIW
jgi:hypothetical protein